MRFKTNLAITALAFTALGTNASAQFVGGTLAVTQVGDGSGTLSSAAWDSFLDDFSTGGALNFTDALPTTPSGSNLASTNSGTATSELQLNIAGNGQSLTLGGYNDPVGTAGAAASTVARVIDNVSLGGSVNSSTSISSFFSGNNIRSVWSPDGSSFYAAGPLGLVYDTLGSSTGVQLLAATNLRDIQGFGGNLYYTTASSGKIGVWEISGDPTSGTVTPTQIISESSGSPYDMLFANGGNTLYIADDGQGIQKWTQSGGVWSLAYTGALTGFTGVRSLTTDGTNLYGIGVTSSGLDDLISTSDTGSGFSAVNMLATPGTDENFRGVRYIPASTPEPATMLGFGLGIMGLIARRRSVKSRS